MGQPQAAADHLILHFALAAAAALVAGGLNAAAGGGSFISFPMLLLLGLPPITANATNNTAMWVGNLGAVSGFRSDFGEGRGGLVEMTAISAVGALLGAILLLHTPESAFSRLIPYLLGFATILFALSPWLRRPASTQANGGVGALVGLFPVAIYGGYFGAGIGIMMLALFAVTNAMGLARMNAVKNYLAFIINGVSVVPFVIARVIAWPEAIVMAIAAVAGGYFGARIVRRAPPDVVRGFVVFVGTAMTVVFFIRR